MRDSDWTTNGGGADTGGWAAADRMKFAEHLSAHITPEWRKQYINYEEMKAMLYVALEEAPSAETVEEDIRQRHYANFDETFFHYCDQELKKINTFYSGEC